MRKTLSLVRNSRNLLGTASYRECHTDTVFRSRFPTVPRVEEPYHKVLLDKVADHEDKKRGRVAFINVTTKETVTFSSVHQRVFSLAAFLERTGFEKGEICCLVLPNGCQFPVAFLGVPLAGGAVSCASHTFTEYELQRQFLDCMCTTVVTDYDNLPKVLRVAQECPQIKTIICSHNGKMDLPSGVFSFEDVTNTNPSQFKEVETDSEDLLFLPYSSGTTGAPKGVMHTLRSYGTLCNSFKDHYDNQVDPHHLGGVPDHLSENALLSLPLYHLLGNILMTKTLLEGSTGITMSKFEPSLFCAVAEEYKMKQLFLVPPLVLFMAKSDLSLPSHFSSLEHLATAAAPLGKDLIEEFKRKYPNVRCIEQGYGQTEYGMATLPSWEPEAFDSCARLVGTCEMKIVDPSTEESLGVNCTGEVWTRSEQTMKGYFNKPKETSDTIDSEGWIRTGDIGYFDSDERLYIVDRLKELIKVKGLQVPPAELEDLLLSHPKVKDAAVIGVPHERTGEAPRAFVVRSDTSVTHGELDNFVKERVSSHKQLTGGIVFVDEIPKSPSGKILRRIIKEELDR